MDKMPKLLLIDKKPAFNCEISAFALAGSGNLFIFITYSPLKTYC